MARARIIPFPRSPRADSRRAGPAVSEVRRCRHQAEALVVRGLLESSGIRVMLRSALAPSVYPFSVGEQAEVAVLVSEHDAERARAILARR